MNMIYITGDTHRDFSRLNNISYKSGDMLIVLGDAGINFLLDDEDKKVKDALNSLCIKIFCIRGNHEERPENIKGYREVEWHGGKVFMEDEFPNLIFAKDGEVYDIDGTKVLVIGGAYSIDKEWRLKYGYGWFKDEQLSWDEMDRILKKVKGEKYDVVMTHTCPYKYEPREVFMSGVDESMVDKSMEHFLDKVEESIDYGKWYCGHYHTEKQIDKLEFMFESVKEFKVEKNMTLKKDIE